METKTKILIVTGVCLVSFATGRYTVPTKTKIETKTVEKVVYKEKDDTKSDLKKHVVIVTKKKPSGETETKTDITYDKKTDEKKDVAAIDNKATDSVKIIEKAAPLNLNALVGVDVHNGQSTYGISASKNLIGPIQTGVFGLTNGTVGVSIGLSL